MNLRRRVCAIALAGSTAAAACAFTCTFGIGCAPNHGAAFPRAFAEAERAETAGRYLEAAARYDAAAKVALLAHDRDHARYTAALMRIRGGELRAGIERLDEIAEASPATEHSADAAYRAASLRIDHGDDQRGWRDMAAVVARFSSHGIAHRALLRIVQHRDETDGVAETLRYLRDLAAGTLGASDVGELLSFQIAEHLARVGDIAAARDQFLRTAARWPYPSGAYWDDALYRASEMDEALGRYPDAIADLEQMLAERETSMMVGSYQRPRMSPALFRIGTLYAYRLNDRAKARGAFHRLYTEFATSTLRPEAMWMEASLWNDDGNPAAACACLETLTREFPASRYTACAPEKCPSLKPRKPSASSSDTTAVYCPPYVLENRAIPAP